LALFFLWAITPLCKKNELQALSERLEQVELEYRGFAYEGAAMALALRDAIVPASSRLTGFMAGAGKQHIYMLHVGAGWA